MQGLVFCAAALVLIIAKATGAKLALRDEVVLAGFVYVSTNALGIEVCWRGRGMEPHTDIAVSRLINVEVQKRCGATLVSCGSVGDRHPAQTDAGGKWPPSGFRVQQRTKHLVARLEHGEVGKERVLGGKLSDHVGLNGVAWLGRLGQ